MIDISRPIRNGAPVFPGDPPVIIEPLARIARGDACNMMLLVCSNHVLTHMDAPYHFFEDGATLDAVPLTRFCGPALVLDAPGPVIPPGVLPPDFAGLSLLFRTGREDASLHPDTAAAIVRGGANLAGIDTLSVDPIDNLSSPAHRVLLRNGVLILEGLDLAAAPPGRYTLWALPLKLERADGAPVRAVLWRDDEDPPYRRRFPAGRI